MNVWARSPNDECLDTKPACKALLNEHGEMKVVMEKAIGFDELSPRCSVARLHRVASKLASIKR